MLLGNQIWLQVFLFKKLDCSFSVNKAMLEGKCDTTIEIHLQRYWAVKEEVKQNCDVKELRLWCPFTDPLRQLLLP